MWGGRIKLTLSLAVFGHLNYPGRALVCLQDVWLLFGCAGCTMCLFVHRTPVDIQPQTIYI